MVNIIIIVQERCIVTVGTLGCRI